MHIPSPLKVHSPMFPDYRKNS
uniref:Uncharacterized protein n=1 Tax=Anguilla anguilla TaxID=7936 RepID=A0A0E9U2F5_ANGAN